MPTHFRWLWYLVGLAGMTLTVVGALALIGSIIAEGLVIPVIVVTIVAILAVIVWLRRKRSADPRDEPETKIGS